MMATPTPTPCLDKFPSSPKPEEVLYNLQRFLGRNSSTTLFGGGPSTSTSTASSSTSNKGIKGKIIKKNVPQPPPQKPPPQEELGMMELTHLGLWLCRHLPVARDSVFELISTMYDQFVKEYILERESNLSTLTEDDTRLLDDIHSAFTSFLESNGEVWAPILSTWSLHLLGQLSKEYADRIHYNFGQQMQNVNDTIRFWMGSKAIQSLMDVTAKCLTCRDKANADTFISALIDASTIHSPRFDWVVAHVGNTCPQTVVSQVLNLGFQHFSQNPPSPLASIKLNSVQGILEHLTLAHTKEVQQAFDQSIQQGLTDPNLKLVILYLLTMCSKSIPLLDVLMDTILPRINEETLSQLMTIVPHWIKGHFGGKEGAVLALVTHLIMKSSRGPRALQILMSGCKSWKDPIDIYARTLLDYLIAEVGSMFYESDSPRQTLATNFPAFPALKEHASSTIFPFLTEKRDDQLCRASKQLVKILGMYDGPAIGVRAICHYLREAEGDKHLWHVVDLISMLEMKYNDILSETLHILAIPSVHEEDTKRLHKWRNILRIMKSEQEKSSKIPIRNKISSIIGRDTLSVLVPLIDVRKPTFLMEEGALVIEIISRIPNIPGTTSFGVQLTLERHLIEYLFKVVGRTDLTPGQKIKSVSHICKILHEICGDGAIQNDALRSLVQFSLYPEAKQLFMPRVVGNPKLSYSAFDYDCVEFNGNNLDNEFQPEKFSIYNSLLEENQKRSSLLNSIHTGSQHSTTFHSGRILKKNGLRNWSAMPKVVIRENEDAELNFHLFLTVLMNVCSSKPSKSDGSEVTPPPPLQDLPPTIDGMRKVALLLVEIVSPDVMFNGLPWPEEEFSKVQVERDLQIRRAFEDHPYLWDMLELVGYHNPSLCYCSVLLRALMATLMAYWASSQEGKTRKSPAQLEWTIRLLKIMRTGELLPPPLCYVGQVIHELRAHEVLGLLKDVWNYMRINVPTPQIFLREKDKFLRNPELSKVDSVYTEKLRLAILNNIESLGYLYPKLFPVPLINANGNGSNSGNNNS